MVTLKQDHFNIGSKFVFHMLLNGLQLHSSSPLIEAVDQYMYTYMYIGVGTKGGAGAGEALAPPILGNFI